ncbi:hypothetical protein WJX75_007774 [Coccomyxa subellipsoidea]|uniref:Uncharacterized protein n=1 Tax=Coccomyxa subellipsoidea TaxID=248742 RepID=A0ABR2YWL5_9CHLO
MPGNSTSESLLPDQCEHVHYSQRASWLREVYGANDGLVSVASIMLGNERSLSKRWQCRTLHFPWYKPTKFLWQGPLVAMGITFGVGFLFGKNPG